MAARKIALFIPSMEGGGAERVAVNLSSGFIARGLEVEMLLVKEFGPLLKLLPSEVRVKSFEKSRAIYSVWCLAAYLRQDKPDALIASMNHTNLVAVLAVKLSRYKGRLILTEQNSIQLDLVRKGGWKNRLILWLMKRMYKHSHKVIAVSSEVEEELKNIAGLRNTICIYNPVDNPEHVDAVDMIDELHLPAVNHGKKTILAVGRLVPQKNFPLLIKSIAIVRKHLPVKLNILGEGGERCNLEGLINDLELSEVVILRGYSDQPGKWLQQSDLFVLSSSWEGFGLVIAEALAAGVTVVSTDCPSGPAEILENGKYGYLVPVDDPEKMAEAILHALKNPLDPELLKKRAEAFSIPHITEQYLNIIFPDEKPCQDLF